jgi:hypothetical protein
VAYGALLMVWSDMRMGMGTKCNYLCDTA